VAIPAEPIATTIPGCLLRPWRAEDKPALVRNANNRKVWRNLTDLFPHPYTDADADGWLAHAVDAGRSVHLAIEVDGQAAGGIGAIAGQGVARATAMFGYWLGEPYWGRGIATAAAMAFADYLQRERLFARLEAPVFEWNPASMRVLEKAGFAREGVLRKSVTKDGQLIDSVLYALVL
jgi:RimJ/RimL family protein N-acetyltransferase